MERFRYPLRNAIAENMMEYKGFSGSVEYSPADQRYYGKVQGVRALVSYEGSDTDALVTDFRRAVDDYLALCEEDGAV